MMGGGGANDGVGGRNETDVATVTLENVLVFESEEPSLFGVGAFGIVGEAERDFADGETGEIIRKWLLENLRSFNGTAEAVQIERVGGNFGKLATERSDVFTAKKRLELSEGKFCFATENGKILHNKIIIPFCK